MRALTCAQVLEVLSDYVDGELSAAGRAEVEHHLSGCDNCTAFGGEFAQVVRAIRAKLGVASEPPDEVSRRLEAALDRLGAPGR